jgi:hypothetical protein
VSAPEAAPPRASAPDPGRAGPSGAARARDTLVAALAGLAATLAAVGWLYLLRHAQALAAGPRLSGALPLQRLAGGDPQPLARFLAAWLPAGVLAGVAAAWLAPSLAPAARASVVGAVALGTLWAAGALSDAVTANETFGAHVWGQAGHGATWAAAGVLACCANAIRRDAG